MSASYPLSVRTDIYNKENASHSAHGWLTATMTAYDLLMHHASGYAWSVSVYREGHRKIENIIETRWLALDIEPTGDTAPLTLDQMEGDNWFTQFVGFIAPTASHTANAPRYRAGIALDRSVTASEYAVIHAVFRSRYPGQIDSNAKDAARFLYGASQSGEFDGYANNDAVLSVDEFLAAYAITPEPKIKRDTSHAGVTMDGLDWQTLESVELNPVFVPQHLTGEYADVLSMLDHIARIFEVVKFEYQFRFRVMAAAHNATAGDPQVMQAIYEDDRFWTFNKVETRDAFPSEWANYQTIEQAVGYPTLKRLASIAGWVPTGRFIPDAEIITSASELLDTVIIQAVTGAGKTEMLLEDMRGSVRGVCIAHRVSLIQNNTDRQISAGLTAHHYGKVEPSDVNEGILNVTIDSLYRFSHLSFDTIYLEEGAQHYSNFLGTMSDEMALRNFEALERIIRNAKRVRLSDATATTVQLDWLKSLRGNDVQVVTLEPQYTKAPAVTMDTNRQFAYEQFCEAYEAGEKFMAFCESAGDARDAYDELTERYPIGRFLLVTSENQCTRSQRQEAERFLQNPNDDSYDGILYTTAMSTGFSINRTRYDHVFMLVSTRFLPITDLVQAANRARRRDALDIFIVPSRGNLPLPIDQYVKDVADAESFRASFGGTRNERYENFIREHLIWDAEQKLYGRSMLKKMLERDGIAVHEAPDYYGSDESIVKRMKARREARKQRLIDALNGNPANDNEAERAKSYRKSFEHRWGEHEFTGEEMLQISSYREASIETGDLFLLQTLPGKLAAINSTAQDDKSDREAAYNTRLMQRALLIQTLRKVFRDLREKLSYEVWLERFPAFLDELDQYHGFYDKHATRKRRWDTVTGNDEERAYKFVKQIAEFAGVDIKQARVWGSGEHRGKGFPEIVNLERRVQLGMKRPANARLNPQPCYDWNEIAAKYILLMTPLAFEIRAAGAVYVDRAIEGMSQGMTPDEARAYAFNDTLHWD